MKYTLKSISASDFFNKLENYHSEIENFTEENNIEDSYLYKSKSDLLINEVEDFLGKNIIPSSTEICKLLESTYDRIFDRDLSHYGIKRTSEISY